MILRGNIDFDENIEDHQALNLFIWEHRSFPIVSSINDF